MPTRAEYDADLNRITARRFERAARASGWRVVHMELTHTGGPVGAVLKRVPLIREAVIKRIICVLEKS